ncbi:cell wall-binding repeat-containing protein [Herbiconiux sp. UC225_62]|uniref:cell wall-binding repeat-containing protein n=1 Tax=Herbiconiux sp. UC225_62 TaxID=3350168 RepID=UPI0036D3DD74
MNALPRSRRRHPLRWLLALTLAAALAAVPTLAPAQPAQAAATPVAVDDAYTTAMDAPLSNSESVLMNDTLGDAQNWRKVMSPAHGTLYQAGKPGFFTYSPVAGFSGTDSFQYCLSPNLAGEPCVSNVATVTINVLASVPADDHFETGVSTALTIRMADALANDANADPNHVAWNVRIEGPRNGTLSSPDGKDMTFVPTAGFIGTDMFKYCLAYAAGLPCETPNATVFINVGLPATSRIAGADRYEVAVQIANGMFPTTAHVLFIASGVNYPDALSAGPAAAKLGGALLLTLPDRVPDNVAAKVSSLKPGRIVIVGGVNSVSEAVAGQLKTLVPGATVERIGGADRYEVSRAIADKMFGPFAHADVTTGATFADALSAGAAAGTVGEPVVLVRGDAQTADAPTLALFAAHATSSLTIVGGINSVSAGVETSLQKVGPVARIGGADRFEASSNLNHAAFAKADTVYLATGLNFPDALAGSVLAGSTKSPLYVVPKSCVPKAVIDDIVRLGAKKVVLLGGPNSLTDEVAKLYACTP